jgi:hypothetical protein
LNHFYFQSKEALAMVQSTKPPISGANDLEREIKEEFRNRPPVRTQPADVAPPSVRAPSLSMPAYVEHHDGATEIGKLSAEGVVREYEAAAKEIEAMGAKLIDLVKQCEMATREAFTVTDELKEIAARYREEAKRVFVQIENCSRVTAEVRKTCAELQEKIDVPAMIETKKVETRAAPGD